MKPALLHFLLLGFTVCVFAPSLGFPFLEGWDDDVYIINNSAQLSWTVENVCRWFREPFAHNYHPLTMISFMVDQGLWGQHAVGYRVHTLCWHLVAVSAVFAIFRIMQIQTAVAWTAALVFAIHPQRVESVVWISERKDVLCAAFYFLALWLYVRRRTAEGRSTDWLAFACFFLALMSKTMAVSLPVVLLFYEWHARRQHEWLAVARRLWAFFLLAIVFVPIAIHAQGSAIQSDVTLLRRAGVVVHNFFWYIHKLVAPVNLSPLYPRVEFDLVTMVVTAVTGMILILAVGWLAHFQPTTLRYLFLPIIASYAAVLAPVAGFIPLGGIDNADRYAYFVAPFIILGIICLISAIRGSTACLLPERETSAAIAEPEGGTRRSPRTILTITGACLCFLVLSHLVYAPSYKSMYHLLDAAYARPNPNPVAIGALAEQELALKNYDRVFQLAGELENRRNSHLADRHLQAHKLKADFLRASALLRTGKPEPAAVLFETLVPHLGVPSLVHLFSPRNVYIRLGESYQNFGRFEHAIAAFDQVIGLQPDDFSALVNRGVCRYSLGRYAAAAIDFEAALRVSPESAHVAHNLRLARQMSEETRSPPPD